MPDERLVEHAMEYAPQMQDEAIRAEGGRDPDTGLQMQWEPQETGRIHVVSHDETLRTIAEEELGDPDLWRVIADLNADRVGNPDMLYPGQEIVLPR